MRSKEPKCEKILRITKKLWKLEEILLEVFKKDRNIRTTLGRNFVNGSSLVRTNNYFD